MRGFSTEKSPFSISGEAMKGRSAYLDGAATTPIDPRVLDAMLPWMTSQFGNAHSRCPPKAIFSFGVCEKGVKRDTDLFAMPPAGRTCSGGSLKRPLKKLVSRYSVLPLSLARNM